MSGARCRRLVLFGDLDGIPELLSVLDASSIAGIVGASIRPHHLGGLGALALDLGVPLLIQPRATDPGGTTFGAQFEALGYDMAVCHSYSMLLRPEILRAVRGQAINVHASLLPKNRGPNPVQWAIMRGESETGVTLHFMDEGFDSGDICAQRSVPIDAEDTWVTLSAKLGTATRDLLSSELRPIVEGCGLRHPQDNTKATRNQRLGPQSPRIDFATMSDLEIYNLVRAQVRPLKGAYIDLDGIEIRLPEFIPLQQIAALRAKYAPRAMQTSRQEHHG